MVVLLALCGAGLSALILFNWADLIRDPEYNALQWERAKRRGLWMLGQTLPGTPGLANLDDRLKAAGLSLGQPILLRIFKREFELEIWMRKGERFQHFATYPICLWSGRLGPKLRQGDRQAPEGFYAVSSASLNPQSRWHRSFNLGFPNLLDRTHGRTGSYLMVHGGCSSVGCYAMTNDVIDEIWRIVTSALAGGQRRFQVQAFPFRMTDANLAEQSGHRWHSFWKELKVGSDLFEATGLPPRVSVCNGSYAFQSGTPRFAGELPLVRSCPKDGV